jgi:hypothetical protein
MDQSTYRYGLWAASGSHASIFWHVRRSGRYSEHSVSRCLRTVVRSLLYPPTEWNTHAHSLLAFFRRCVFPPHILCFAGLCVRHAVWRCVFPPLCVSLSVCTPRYLCDCVWWEWCSVLKKLLLTTRSVCGRCRRCQGGCCGKTVLRIGIFSRTCLVTRNLQLLIMLQLLPPINTHHP